MNVSERATRLPLYITRLKFNFIAFLGHLVQCIGRRAKWAKWELDQICGDNSGDCFRKGKLKPNRI